MTDDREAADNPPTNVFSDAEALEQEKDRIRREEARLKRERSQARSRGDTDRVAALREEIRELMHHRRSLRLRPAPAASDEAPGEGS